MNEGGRKVTNECYHGGISTSQWCRHDSISQTLTVTYSVPSNFEREVPGVLHPVDSIGSVRTFYFGTEPILCRLVPRLLEKHSNVRPRNISHGQATPAKTRNATNLLHGYG